MPRPPWRWPSASQRCQLASEIIKAQRAERQRGHVPRLQVEVTAAGRPRGLAPGQPGALAQLVADGLARQAEITDDLTFDEGPVAAAVGGEELARQLRRPYLAR